MTQMTISDFELTAEELGLDYQRKLDRNFFLADLAGHAYFVFWKTVIMRHVEGSTWRICTGGYWTLTTKDRLNKALREAGHTSLSVWQEQGKWYLSDFHTSYQKKDAVQLFDGIVIDLVTLKVANPEEGAPVEFDRQHYEKLISQYCKALKALEKLPAQDAGDCWFCHFMEDPTNTSHLIAHLEECYIHGSLILNALCAAGKYQQCFQCAGNRGLRGEVRQWTFQR